MRYWFKPALLFSLFFVPAVTGCLLAPTGTNKSPTVYATPSGHTISIPYKPSVTTVSKVTFAIEGSDVAVPLDDSAADGFFAVVDISTLSPGFYTVDAMEDDGTDIKGKLTLLVPADAAASGTADTKGSGTAATATSTSGTGG